MSKLSQLHKSKKYDINGVEFEFRSVEIDGESTKMLEDPDVQIDKKLPTIKNLLKKMLKESVPDATEKELQDCMRMQTLLPLVNAFYDVNGLTDQENISNADKIKNALQKHKDNRKSKK